MARAGLAPMRLRTVVRSRFPIALLIKGIICFVTVAPDCIMQSGSREECGNASPVQQLGLGMPRRIAGRSTVIQWGKYQ